MENITKFNSELPGILCQLEELRAGYQMENNISIHHEVTIKTLIDNHVNSAISSLLALNDHLENIKNLPNDYKIRLYLESIEK